jgi:hypothetical protein
MRIEPTAAGDLDKGKDLKNCQEALSKGQSASKEGCCLIAPRQRTSL